MMQRAIRFIEKEPTLVGPLSLLFTIAVGVKTAIPFDLLFLSVSGLLLCARFKTRGCAYSLILLSIRAIIQHAFITSDHLWELGLEGSLACAFFLMAFGFEQGSSLLESLHSQVETRKNALANLEEELAKVQEDAQSQQVIFQEKRTLLQKELEDLQSDHSAILVLNEVLRQTTARHVQENETLASRLFEMQRDKGFLKEELEALEEESVRLKNSDPILLENQALIKELNQARYQREEALLFNETLKRLTAREALRAKEANEEAASMADQLAAARKEVRRISIPLEEQIGALKKEVETLTFQFEKVSHEANQARSQLLHSSQIQSERNFLRERLEAALEEIALLQNQRPKENPEMEEKVKKLSQIEPLFKQLKKQFEEKDQVLHQARKSLFKVETELEKVKIEKSALELNSIPKEETAELEALSVQIATLEEENKELGELVTLLSSTPKGEKKN
jgi:chromosome segregation ATPase